jgi:hypothetical protein
MRSTLSDLSTLLRSGFAYTPLSRAVFICKLPFVSLDDLHRLHGTDGPAMQFDDGYKIYALCGVPVRRELIEAPEQLTFQQIDRERNAELRRVLIERYGLINYVRDSGAGIKDRTEEGTLYLKQQAADEPIALVLVRNKTAEADGTFKEYFLRVPPSIRTVREALAWTFGLSAEQYNPSVET